MSTKPVAIIAAMPIELAPLLGRLEPEQVKGVDIYELPQAVVAVGGIGEKYARLAADVAIEYAQPKLLVSAGIVGAISPALKVGDVGRIREAIDLATGARYSAAGGGEWVLVTSQDVSGPAQKQELRKQFGADVVDMEAAAVAQVAQEHGVEFACIKSVSDDAQFDMPPLNRFIDANGKFATKRFLVYVALHPKWWSVLGRIRENSGIAAANLCAAVTHLIDEYYEKNLADNRQLTTGN